MPGRDFSDIGAIAPGTRRMPAVSQPAARPRRGAGCGEGLAIGSILNL
jgi:hypothetical protein